MNKTVTENSQSDAKDKTGKTAAEIGKKNLRMENAAKS